MSPTIRSSMDRPSSRRRSSFMDPRPAGSSKPRTPSRSSTAPRREAADGNTDRHRHRSRSRDPLSDSKMARSSIPASSRARSSSRGRSVDIGGSKSVPKRTIDNDDARSIRSTRSAVSVKSTRSIKSTKSTKSLPRKQGKYRDEETAKQSIFCETDALLENGPILRAGNLKFSKKFGTSQRYIILISPTTTAHIQDIYERIFQETLPHFKKLNRHSVFAGGLVPDITNSKVISILGSIAKAAVEQCPAIIIVPAANKTDNPKFLSFAHVDYIATEVQLGQPGHFALRTGSEDYHFSAETSVDYQEWERVLLEAMELAKNSVRKTTAPAMVSHQNNNDPVIPTATDMNQRNAFKEKMQLWRASFSNVVERLRNLNMSKQSSPQQSSENISHQNNQEYYPPSQSVNNNISSMNPLPYPAPVIQPYLQMQQQQLTQIPHDAQIYNHQTYEPQIYHPYPYPPQPVPEQSYQPQQFNPYPYQQPQMYPEPLPLSSFPPQPFPPQPIPLPQSLAPFSGNSDFGHRESSNIEMKPIMEDTPPTPPPKDESGAS